MKECLRFLIPTYKPGGLNAKIFPHWKDAPIFTEVCFNENGIREFDTFELKSDTLIIEIVKKRKVKGAIALSLSIRAIELLNKKGVTVFTGKVKTVQDAVQKYLRKELYIVKLVKISQVEAE
ncbi:hypothetical protein DRO59_02880 [Candidatus Bathyarchaeota archaeon]|nr:MAG: hypothetical protein DRO59_02880 [Candidatus Bathyarchaeota archaeon]